MGQLIIGAEFLYIDIQAKKEYNYIYDEGRLVRATENTITLNGEMVTGRTVVNTVRYKYNSDGQMTSKVITPASGSAFTYYFTHSDDNTSVQFTAGGRTITSHSKTDSFGRKIFDELQLGTDFVTRQFTYYAGQVTEEHQDNAKLKSAATTQLVSQIVLSDGRTLSYEYDEEERITKVTDSFDGTTEYTYDALGQLLTETVDGVIVNSMVYDNYGNILSKNGVAYEYCDDAWKDKLTAVGDDAIKYDAQGNPVSYLGHTMTWEKGRQLKSFDNITYTYNANGIRTSKTVNGVKHTYTLDGTNILRETWGSNTLIPLYDNEDTVCGIIYNSTPYYFLKNLQGDVIAITDATGAVVAEYSYDAWGKCTITCDCCGIAAINPYRYRGYYYDVEIGFYYVSSRYYNPEIGRFISSDDSEMVVLSNILNLVNLFSYCDNGPVFDFDCGGYISFAGVKKAIKNIVDNIKSFVVNLVNYIKNQFQNFINKVSCHFNKGRFLLPTAPIGLLIDAVIATIAGVVKGALLKGGFSLIKLWFKSNKPALKVFVKNTVIPMLKNTDALFNSLIRYIANRFCFKSALVITKATIENQIWGNYDFYKWVSAVSSVGSFIATFLDILDGKWDDHLSI